MNGITPPRPAVVYCRIEQLPFMKQPAAVLLATLALVVWAHAQAITPTLPNINTANNFNAVTGYGASTGSANNASAINTAITAAAAASGGGTVEIPAGYI